MYQYKNFCYVEPERVFAAMAADCDPILSDGSLVSCVPDLTGFDVVRTGFSTVHHAPNLVACTLDVAQVGELVMLVWGVLVVAAGFMYLKRPIR